MNMEAKMPKGRRKKFLFFFSILTFSLISIASFAQLNPNYLTFYTQQDGLPATQVNDLIIDRLGYVWVGTVNGLARFDGYQFKRFYNNPNDPGSIKGMMINALFEDSKGRIWISSSPSFLNMYDPLKQSFTHFQFEHLMGKRPNDEPNISSIIERDGTIFFSIRSSNTDDITPAFLYFNENEGKVSQVDIKGDMPIFNLFESTLDEDGNFWLVGSQGLLKLEEDGKLTQAISSTHPELKDELLADCLYDNDGGLWLITNRARIGYFNIATGKLEFFTPIGLHPPRIYHSLCLALDGNLWMGTNFGLFLFDRKTKKATRFAESSKTDMSQLSVASLKYDSFGNLWIGTWSDGLVKYEEKSIFKALSPDKSNPNSITPGWVNEILETSNGEIWITTSGIAGESGINILDPKNLSIQPFPYGTFPQGIRRVFGMMEHSSKEVYMSTDIGLFSFSKVDRKFKNLSLPGLTDSLVVNHFLRDRMENLWLSTNSGMFRKGKNENSFRHFDLRNGQDGDRFSNEVKLAIESEKYGLWLLTNFGLFLYDYKTDHISRKGYDSKEGDIFMTQDINSFYEDPNGIAWVGTWNGGLSRYDVEKGKIQTFTINDGLASMSIQSILADDQHNSLWMSTFEGISRLDLNSMRFYNYTVEEGIQNQLFTDGAFLRSSSGFFLFGGANGITIFDPNQTNQVLVPPRVFLTDLKLFNKSVIPGEKSILQKHIYDTDEIVLKYNQNNISIEFIAFHYSNPAKNTYSYKLENYDQEWREVSGFQAAFYSNLPPGEYKFHVKAANNVGAWNEEGAQLRIIVENPWWNTIWAKFIYGLVLVTGIFGADRFFRNQVVVKERAKSRERELIQAKKIELAYKELKATQAQLIQSEKMASLGELTAGIAHVIQNPLNFVNNFSEVSSELVEEIQDIRRKTQDKATANEEDEILEDIKQNLEKITQHGRRADAIVKGMLEHSRVGLGEKIATDINVLTDEYLRLAFHGLRSKDSTFNAKFQTSFDDSLSAGEAGIGKINIIPQDISRVILNITTNAFYAVNERAKLNPTGYLPIVSLSTKKQDNKVFISIKDNGNGIPSKILDKIFQPFFTTKPTGQGTGLGLSLSYDIVKAHGGELRLETKVGVGTEFMIILPIQNHI